LGDGFLTTPGQTVPRSSASDEFTYDPLDPVPTVGGNLLGPDTLSGTVGFADQSKVELRNDVLVYTSSPLTRDYAVIGTITTSFWAITSAADTDFTVKLVDVRPDGLTNNVVDRIVGARYRLGSTKAPSFITPGQPEHYAFDVGNTAMMFRTGHRIRVEISSSNFPKFARNLNTTLSERFQGSAVTANQTLLHSTQYPSYVGLPIAPNVTIP
jgi:putative CocE/NonD family hydrolase